MVANDAKLFVSAVRVARLPSHSGERCEKSRAIFASFDLSTLASMDAEDELRLMLLEQEIAIAYACR